jgi:hypothetical protein
MFPSFLIAASIATLSVVDARTRIARDPRGPRYGVGYDPIGEALSRAPRAAA